ncbi:YtxH domain-containing protein [Halalkalibacter urbisdiaboli]|uniref:YtxH domain-containing protein n=1 Tax=Halalkalibacter urbisdiaboli TaxID=1960589 RepID=UPI000B43F936|nr:YtxH domain-containing protein [Halalkalibacter urbisdiaboli]
MERKACRSLCKGIWIGGAVTVAALLLKKEWRSKLIEEASEFKHQSAEVITFIRENREDIFNQVKMTTSEVSNVVQGISDDIKQLTSTVKHLKDSSEELVKVTKEAAKEVRDLKNIEIDE